MTYNTRSTKQETSQQGSMRSLQQEVPGVKESTDERIDKLQEAIEMLVSGMQGLMSMKPKKLEEILDEEEETPVIVMSKGVFRNPTHAAWERQKLEQQQQENIIEEEDYEETNWKTDKKDSQSLKHLKLSFPVYKAHDTMEWLTDCEEYFTLFEVSDKRRSAIATMHLTGTPRSSYKSFMIGRINVTWNQFSQAFVARFGEVDTELVFDKFKKLQQTTTVEAYFDEFEKCRGQLLMKIPSLTTEYFLENFIGGLQVDIRGMLRLLEPTSLEQALKLARFYEQTLSSQPKRSTYSSGTYKANTATTFVPKVSTEAALTSVAVVTLQCWFQLSLQKLLAASLGH